MKKWLIKATLEVPYPLEVRGVAEAGKPGLAINKFLNSQSVKDRLIQPGKKRPRRWEKAVIIIQKYEDAAEEDK